MKNFIVLSVFISTMIFGLAVTESFDLSGKFKNYLHRDCARWEGEIMKKPLFTLTEIKPILGKKVISKNEYFEAEQTGRVIHFEMVGQNKFLAVIYWGNGADDNDSTLTFHDKQGFSENFKITD